MAKCSSLVKSTRMKKLALLVLGAAACSGQVQETRKETVPSPAAAAPAVVAAPSAGNEVAIDYRPQSEGHALIEVAGAARAPAHRRGRAGRVGRGAPPLAAP